ncbi:MAG: MFS transporter [Micropruina sp.]|uniref:MFS transporter n=1 Tax=Micropruina sp. TaxID=2737536 RepID=UPI0039E55101
MRSIGLFRRNPDFARFWAGETVSLFGTQISGLALPLTALLVLNVGATEMGILRALAFLPFLVVALPFGALADRHARRPLMIAANLIRAPLVMLVPVLVATGLLNLPVLAVIVLAIGVCTVLFEVCWLAYVPDIVAREDLIRANGRVSASASAAEFAGPGLGGALTQWLTAPFALLANGLTYLLSVASLLSIRSRELPRTAVKRRIASEIAGGLRFIAGEPFLRLLTVTGAAYNFCYMFVEALLILYLVQQLGFSPGVVGLVIALGALGGLAGAACAGTLLHRFRFGRVFAWAVVIGYAGPALIPAVAAGTPGGTAVVVGGLFLMRAGLAVSNVAGTSLRQAVTPPEMMGRMTAGMRTISWGIGTTGALVGGLAGDLLGLRFALWVAVAGFLGTGVIVLLSRIPGLSELPEPARPGAAPTSPVERR